MSKNENVKPAPEGVEGFDKLKGLTHDELLEKGLLVWEILDIGVHYLYPCEWFDSIPEGYEVLTISNQTEKFCKNGQSNDDQRFGALAYGFFIRAESIEDTSNEND